MKEKILYNSLYVGILFGLTGVIPLIILDLNYDSGPVGLVPVAISLMLSVICLQGKTIQKLFKASFVTYAVIFLAFLVYSLFYKNRMSYAIFTLEFLKIIFLNLFGAITVSAILTLIVSLIYKLKGSLEY